MSSICCKARTHIGYFNITKRPDLFGVKKTHNIFAIIKLIVIIVVNFVIIPMIMVMNIILTELKKK